MSRRAMWMALAVCAIGLLTICAAFMIMRTGEDREAAIEHELERVLPAFTPSPPRKPVPLRGKAIWVWGVTVEELGADRVVEICKGCNITHIFLLVKGVSGYVNRDIIKELLPRAHKAGIYVHAWFVCFVDKSWPGASPDNPAYREYLLKLIAEFLTMNVSGEYIDGVHLDYVRYPGFASASKARYVTSFVAHVRQLIDQLAPGAVLSIASKAEDYSSPQKLLESALYYGQDYRALAKYVDLFCPMTYFLDYGVSPEEAIEAACWVKQLTGKAVFAGVQCHACEHDPSRRPTPDEVRKHIELAREKGLDGVCFFNLRSAIENGLLDAIKEG